MAMTMKLQTSPAATRAVDRRTTVLCHASKMNTNAAGLAALVASNLLAGPASALTYDQLQSLTYKQVKGSGIANTCPVIESGTSGAEALQPGKYRLERFCMEPTSFRIKDESPFRGGADEFVDTQLMTRMTYTLDQMTGSLVVDKDGGLEIKEEDGMDYAPVTVRLPGGEHVPFLFSIKQLDAKGNADALLGDFTVPSYRGSSFMDPKGRGAATGYETQIGLQSAQDKDDILRENAKNVRSHKGSAVLSVAKVDTLTGEVAGIFETMQPTDDDMGAKDPKELKVTGLWYGQITPDA